MEEACPVDRILYSPAVAESSLFMAAFGTVILAVLSRAHRSPECGFGAGSSTGTGSVTSPISGNLTDWVGAHWSSGSANSETSSPLRNGSYPFWSNRVESIELFAGAGGLAMGVAQAGFQHLGIVEYDQWCCETINDNRRRRISPVANWPAVAPTDVRDICFQEFPSNISLVSGGPPCQPFSLGGKHRGHADARNLFPDLVRAVRVLRPRALIVENVKGLLRQSFDPF